MSVFDSLKDTAGKVAVDVQQSLRKAKLDGERRVLQRQQRAALERLGARAYDLAKAGRITPEDLAVEVADVESKLMEIDAKTVEIAALRSPNDGDDPDGTAG